MERHINWKDVMYIAILVIGFAMHYAAFQTRISAMEISLNGPPPLANRIDRMEQAMIDIRDSLADIKNELRHK